MSEATAVERWPMDDRDLVEIDENGNVVRTSGARHRWCRYAGPGRGDCENFVGLPATMDETTTDEYGIPHGWCDYCWQLQKGREQDERMLKLERERDGLREALLRGGAPRDGVWHRYSCIGNPCSSVCAAQRAALAGVPDER